ncbi:hypothetical protein HD806DRAFT_528067 [Xylariaceae sp. AK1471]|nr:hypothetical protein HD806DRAFT_528067 [Xylariaceae sp. AK1471]
MSATGDNSTSYAPRSPDLSSFYTGPEGPSISSRPNNYLYAFPNPGTSISASASGYPLQHPAQAQAQAQAQVQTRAQAQAQAAAHNYSQLGSQPHHQYQTHHYNNTNNSSNSSTSTATATITNHNHNAYHLPPQQQQQQHPPLAAFNNNNNTSHPSLSPYPHQSGLQYNPPQQPQPQYPLSHQHSYRPQAAPSYYPPYTEPPTSTPYLPTNQNLPQQKLLHEQQQQQQQQQPPTLVFNQPVTSNSPNVMPRGKAAAPVAKEPEIMESPVRTKFPTARIKRIMQADEEVGKVAQQTPIAVGKALELFMVQLVRKSAEVAKDKNSKRITAPMLKQAIDSTNEWDFLRDIVAKVAEEKEGAKSSGRTKAETDSDDDADTAEVKKKGRGGRKRKAPA